MELWRLAPSGRLRWAAFFVLVAIAAAAGCRRDNSLAIDRNRPPETFVTEGPRNSTDPENPTLLYYRAHLFWRGEDSDGTVTGFRWAVDDTLDPRAWHWTTETDSVFRFEVAQIGGKEHLFLIRAVDNLGKQDATPDTLRFESFTVCPPTINSVTASADEPTLGHVTGLASGDTVEVFSDVTVCWDGADCDGFIVGWETQVDRDLTWRRQDVNDKCRKLTALTPGLHTMNIRAIDDAGATSTDIYRFLIQSNFDPQTELDLSTFTATLKRPWAASDLIIGPGVAEADTLPLGATIKASWSSTDIDGPVVSFSYSFNGTDIIGITDTLSTQGLVAFGGVDTDTTGPIDNNTGLPTPEVLTSTDRIPEGNDFFVKGHDVYQNVELRPRVLRFHVNFQPSAFFDWPSDTVDAKPDGTPVSIPYHGTDVDSDPSLLRFRWQFDQTPATQPIDPPENARFITLSFGQSQQGIHILRLWCQDASGAQRESLPDTVFVRVRPAPEPGALRQEGVQR